MPLEPFTDPNAAASANAGRAMGNVGNLLYQFLVQRPEAQAQTSAIQAGTQLTQ